MTTKVFCKYYTKNNKKISLNISLYNSTLNTVISSFRIIVKLVILMQFVYAWRIMFINSADIYWNKTQYLKQYFMVMQI